MSAPRYTEAEWRLLEEFRRDWTRFSDADPVAPDFVDRMAAAGWCEFAPVTDEALEDPFAYERGIEPGGSMWQLTNAGRAALKQEVE